MRVPLTELARSYYSRYYSAYPEELLPFALQRFMQGRRILVRCADAPTSEINLRVVMWAFAWATPSARFTQMVWIPLWYHLPLSDNLDKHAPELPLCPLCFIRQGEEKFRLAAHTLFPEAQNFINELVTQAGITRRTKSFLSCTPLCAKLPEKLRFLSSQQDNLRYWIGSTKRVSFGTHDHVFKIFALLEVIDCSQILSKGNNSRTLANHILRSVDLCQAVLSGDDVSGKTYDDVSVELRPPRRITASDTGSAEGEVVGAPKAASEMIDRLIEVIHRSAKQSDFNPLEVLFIVRCGETKAAMDQIAHARFLLSNLQRQTIQTKVLKLHEEGLLLRQLLERARVVYAHLREAGTLPEQASRQIRDALVELKLHPPEGQIGDDEINTFDVQSGWSIGKGEDSISGFEQAFKKRFPVQTVVSNRIMGHGSCEEVNELYESPTLYRNLEGYPLSLLLAEQIILPDSLKKGLFYVPMSIPSSVTSGSVEMFFLSYAVAMAPPSLIDQDVFRQIIEREAGTMYGALLMDTYRSLAEAADEAMEVQKALNHNPDAVDEHFSMLSEGVGLSILDAIRLADFRKSSIIEWKRIPFLSNAEWPYLSEAPLTHRPIAEELEKIGQQILYSALLPLLERLAILTRTFRNVWHGGMVDDLAPIIQALGSMRVNQNVQWDKLFSIETRLREIQDRYRSLAKRAGWIFTPGSGCDYEQCHTLYIRAICSVLSRYENHPKAEALWASAPERLEISSDCLLLEEEIAVYDVFLVLLGNVVEHELNIPKGGTQDGYDVIDVEGWTAILNDAKNHGLMEEELDVIRRVVDRQSSHKPYDRSAKTRWGISVSPARENDLLNNPILPGIIVDAYRRWNKGYKANKKAVLLRAFPFTGDVNRFNSLLLQGGQHRQGSSSGMGLVVLATLTRVYCHEPPEVSTGSAVPIETYVTTELNPLPSVGVSNGESSGVFVLIPTHSSQDGGG